MRIAIIEKAPSNNRYSNYFKFDYELFQLCSKKLPKVLKKDVDIEIDIDSYDYVVLVGSEPVKYYTNITSVTDFAGHLVDDKFIPLINPSMVVFKPEAKPAFDKSIERLHAILEGKVAAKNNGKYYGITTEKDALEYISRLEEQDGPLIAVDTETTALYPTDGYVLGISLCGWVGEAVYISSDVITDEITARLQRIFNKRTCIFHNAKFDIKMLQYHFNFKFPVFEDTLVLHYVLDETQGSHGLKSLALKYTDFGDYDSELDTFKKEYCRTHNLLEADFTYDLIPFDTIAIYAAKDTGATMALYNLFKPLVSKNPKLDKLYNSLLIPALNALVEIELAGVPLDRSRLEFAEATISKEIREAVAHLYGLPEIKEFEAQQGKEFNPNSVLQLRKLLFDKLGLKPIDKKTGTGLQSTDKEVLEELAGQHEVVNSIIALRKLGKIKSTYVDNLLRNLDMDGKVRTGFNLTSTTSGRLSSSGKFNAQQLPRDEARVKGAIRGTGRHLGWKIVSQDLATAEMYYAAVLSGDRKLQQVFKDKQDFHSSIAKQVFDLPGPVGDVKSLFKDKRQAAKAINKSGCL